MPQQNDADDYGGRPAQSKEKKVPSITCPTCLKVSYHYQDIQQKYCGFCHRFHAEMEDFDA